MMELSRSRAMRASVSMAVALALANQAAADPATELLGSAYDTVRITSLSLSCLGDGIFDLGNIACGGILKRAVTPPA